MADERRVCVGDTQWGQLPAFGCKMWHGWFKAKKKKHGTCSNATSRKQHLNIACLSCVLPGETSPVPQYCQSAFQVFLLANFNKEKKSEGGNYQVTVMTKYTPITVKLLPRRCGWGEAFHPHSVGTHPDSFYSPLQKLRQLFWSVMALWHCNSCSFTGHYVLEPPPPHAIQLQLGYRAADNSVKKINKSGASPRLV